jgi:hypothetical protein
MKIKDFLSSLKSNKNPIPVIDGEWLKEIVWAIQTHEGSLRVDYGEQQFINVVGEAYHDANIRTITGGQPGDSAGWITGFLLPEPENKFDKNAVAVYAIYGEKEERQALNLGYLPAEVAKIKHDELRNILDLQGKIVPLIMRIKGGDEEFPQYAVIAYAKTDQIVFESE